MSNPATDEQIKALPAWADPYHHVSKRQAQTIHALRARLAMTTAWMVELRDVFEANGVIEPSEVAHINAILKACKEPGNG